MKFIGMPKILLWSLLMTVIFVMGFTTLNFYQSPLMIHRLIQAASLPLTVMRCSGYVLVLLCWPILMRHLAKRKRWDKDYLAHVIAQRYRIFIWLVILELVLGQNILGKFITLFF